MTVDKSAIEMLESSIKDPRKGLPEEIFLFISRITPLVNVDLLIKDEKNRTLLTWRDDGYYSAGWHLPGGIIRFKERSSDRIKAVARHELGAEVVFGPTPIAVNEIIHPTRNIRGHFISLLYRCSFIKPPDEALEFKSGRPGINQWKWHEACPENIIEVHKIYRDFIG